MAVGASIQLLEIGSKLHSKERIYEIVRVLGSGSFGITYLATAKVSVGNISTTMNFAVKEHFISASCYRGEDGVSVHTVPSAQSDVVSSRADFITEANRLKKLCLKSRNIVSVNETFEANGTAYYVMEYLDGGSPSICPEKDAVSIVMQIAEALDEIHKERVLHLDLKPDNIVLKTNERGETYPVLIDFGISKHFDSKGRPTSSLSAKGASPGYAPQEQYAGVNEFSPKYDIYALAAVLFYLCTGKNPPDAFKISPNQQELKKELAGKVSPRVEKAILNAMKPSAAERTSSIQQFCDDLMGVDFMPLLNATSSNLDFGKEKGQRNVTVDSNIGWTVYSDSDWCKVSKMGNEIFVSVSKNKESGNRTCSVIVDGSSYQIHQIIRVQQGGDNRVYLNTENVTSQNNTWKYINLLILGCLLSCITFIGVCSIDYWSEYWQSSLIKSRICGTIIGWSIPIILLFIPWFWKCRYQNEKIWKWSLYPVRSDAKFLSKLNKLIQSIVNIALIAFILLLQFIDESNPDSDDAFIGSVLIWLIIVSISVVLDIKLAITSNKLHISGIMDAPDRTKNSKGYYIFYSGFILLFFTGGGLYINSLDTTPVYYAFGIRDGNYTYRVADNGFAKFYGDKNGKHYEDEKQDIVWDGNGDMTFDMSDGKKVIIEFNLKDESYKLVENGEYIYDSKNHEQYMDCPIFVYHIYWNRVRKLIDSQKESGNK